AVEVPVANAFKGAMLRHCLNDSGATVLVLDSEFVPRLAAVADRLEHLRTVVVVGGAADVPGFVTCTVDEFLDAPPPAEVVPPRPRDVSAILYTSGTTGPSKGVMMPWAHLHAIATGAIPQEIMGPDDVAYYVGPANHQGAKIWPYLIAMAGGSLVVRNTFSTDEYWSDVRKYGATTGALLGAMPHFLFDRPPQPDDADNPLDKIVMAPLHPRVHEFNRRFGTRAFTVYSMTEISAPILVEDWENRWSTLDPASCGTIRQGPPGYEIRLVDEDDEEVPDGQVGELAVRTREPWTLNAGYFNNPAATAEAWRNGWFHTGDAFRRDEQGNYYFVDRIKDCIRRRGENISSFEVEAEACDHPDVVEAAAIAVDADESEDEVFLLAIRRPGATLDAPALHAHLSERLPRFMVPRYIEFVDAFPRTPTERVRKFELRERGLGPNAWDATAHRRDDPGPAVTYVRNGSIHRA
ncbi:MAG TPA: AMP-binding protein, partial [Cellulomonas sp.]|nr:AMP-binding protein [Cellulomonas sp.]